MLNIDSVVFCVKWIKFTKAERRNYALSILYSY